MKVEIFEAINSSNYYRFNLMVLKVFTIFYYYPKQSLMNMREEQDEAEYNEKTTAGQDANIAEQFLYKLIEREYKDQVKGSIQDIKQYVQEGIINFYLKKLMFSNSFQDKIKNNTKNELLELVKQMSKHMDGLLKISGIEITSKFKNFMNII